MGLIQNMTQGAKNYTEKKAAVRAQKELDNLDIRHKCDSSLYETDKLNAVKHKDRRTPFNTSTIIILKHKREQTPVIKRFVSDMNEIMDCNDETLPVHEMEAKHNSQANLNELRDIFKEVLKLAKEQQLVKMYREFNDKG